MNTNDIRKEIEKLIPKGRLYHCEGYEKAALKEALTKIPKDMELVKKKDLLTKKEAEQVMLRSPTLLEAFYFEEKLVALSAKETSK